MSLDAKGAAALALHRFGLGPRAGSIAAIASDPRGALLAELDKPGVGRIVDSGADDGGAGRDARRSISAQERQAQQIAQRQAEESAPQPAVRWKTRMEPKPDEPRRAPIREPSPDVPTSRSSSRR